MEDAYKRHAIAGVRYALYAAALTPLVFSGKFLFPYISVRTIYFRIVIELAVIAALFLWWRYGLQNRARLNYFLFVFGLFTAANIISSFFSFSFSVAWFSDFERMWGVFTLLHLFLFYILLRIFFTGREWRVFLNISLLVSLIVAGYGIVQYYPQVFGIEVFQSGAGRIISTLGNASYVAIYMVFNIFFALFLAFKTQAMSWRLAYAGVIVIDVFALYLTGTRGTILGLLAGGVMASLLYILLGKRIAYKAVIAISVVAIALIFFLAFLNIDKPWVRENSFLNRMASISLTGSSIETRFVGWQAAWRGFLDYPVFGVGMDNYSTLFNRYFDSDYYLYAPNEPYFDRSHNAWLDILAMNGAVGFVIFAGFPLFIVYYLAQGYRRGKMTLDELLIFTALSITYFVHLIFVFDDLNSYMYFVVLLAFIEYRYHRRAIGEFAEQRSAAHPLPAITAVITGIILVTGMYHGNVKVALAGRNVIKALEQPDVQSSLTVFEKAFSYDVIPSRNITLTYVNQILQWTNSIQNISQNSQQLAMVRQALQRGNELLQKEISKDPANALLYNRAAALYNLSYLLTGSQLNLSQALTMNQKSIELSREHLQYYYTLADTYFIAGDTKQALTAVKEAVSINSQYQAGHLQLMRAYLADGQLNQAFYTARILVDENYTQGTDQLLLRLADEFAKAGEGERVIATLELANELYPQNGQLAAGLMRKYLKTKRYDEAVTLARKIGTISDDLRRQADYLIQEIQAGRGEEVLAQMEER